MRYLPASVSRWTTNQSLVVVTTPLQEYAVWVHLSWRTIPLSESLGEFSPRSGPELGEFLPCEDGDYSTFILLWAS